MKISTEVRRPTRNEPLLDYMAQRFTYRPRDAWADLIMAQQITVNGQAATAQTLISAGDTIVTMLPEYNLPDANYDYDIVFEDAWLLAVNKPSNLRVHGRGRYTQANLIYHLRERHQPPYPTAELIHRLDADTSGLVLLAKDKETLRRMNALFAERVIEKCYMAIVHGVPDPQAGMIESMIGRLPSLDGVFRFGSGPKAEKVKLARSHYEVGRILGDGYATVYLWPETGRTHQLRVHMAEQGHPLVGDALYQMTDIEFLQWRRQRDIKTANSAPLPLSRPALHALRSRFIHPWTELPIEIEAPLAADMVEFVANTGS